MNSGTKFLRDIKFLFQYWERLFDGVRSDIQKRYAGSVLGRGWAILYPITLLLIYSILYVVVFRIRPPTLDQYSYVVSVFSGLVPVLLFNEALNAAVGSLLSHRALLMNTVFPAELIPVRSILAAQIPSMFGMSATLIAAIILDRATLITFVGVPILWLLLLMFITGLGWFLSLMTLVFRDIQQFIGLILISMFMLSPIAYTPEMVPPALKVILYANPLAYFVMAFQSVICYGVVPEPLVVCATLVLGCGTWLSGYWFFRRAKFVFFDYA